MIIDESMPKTTEYGWGMFVRGIETREEAEFMVRCYELGFDPIGSWEPKFTDEDPFVLPAR
jgi:hypothetical protein